MAVQAHKLYAPTNPGKFDGKVKYKGLNIDIENAAGTERSGVSKDGKTWSTVMKHHYGELRGVTGADDENLDIYVGKNKHSTKVFIVHINKGGTTKYDEDKIFLGFDDVKDVKKSFQAHYSNNKDIFRSVTEMSLLQFRDIIKSKKNLCETIADTLSLETLKEVVPLLLRNLDKNTLRDIIDPPAIKEAALLVDPIYITLQ